MSTEITGSCQVDLGPPEFVFASTAIQTAANTVYEAKKAFDNTPANLAAKRVYTFKTDYERMQYKLGLYGRTSTGNA
jgi:hypothetical protein